MCWDLSHNNSVINNKENNKVRPHLTQWFPCVDPASSLASWVLWETEQTPQWPGIQTLNQSQTSTQYYITAGCSNPQPITDQYTILHNGQILRPSTNHRPVHNTPQVVQPKTKLRCDSTSSASNIEPLERCIFESSKLQWKTTVYTQTNHEHWTLLIYSLHPASTTLIHYRH